MDTPDSTQWICACVHLITRACVGAYDLAIQAPKLRIGLRSIWLLCRGTEGFRRTRRNAKVTLEVSSDCSEADGQYCVVVVVRGGSCSEPDRCVCSGRAPDVRHTTAQPNLTEPNSTAPRLPTTPQAGVYPCRVLSSARCRRGARS